MFQKSRFQSWFLDFGLEFLSTDVSKEDSDTESDYKEEIWSDSKDDLAMIIDD